MTLTGYVLDRIVHGEKFWRVVLATREKGVCACLVRISGGAKSKQICVPDLFDEVEVTLPQGRAGTAGDLLVAKEFRTILKCGGISRDYEVLIHASRWTFVLAKNPVSQDAAGTLFSLAEKVLKAFAEKPFPAATYFKGLWMLAKISGYPVKEDWFERLVYDEREAVCGVLMTPLEALKIDARMLRHIVQRLENWLSFNHHFRFNDNSGAE